MQQVFNLKIKLCQRISFLKSFRDIKKSTPHISGWVTIEARLTGSEQFILQKEIKERVKN